MKKPILQTTVTGLLLGSLLVQAGAGETARPRAVQTRSVTTSTSGYVPIREFRGNLTLARAVDIALHQNPDILTAIQEIERTRGLIIEVRAAVLPQITLSGDFEQQDRRLLKGGGATGGGAGNTTAGVSAANLSSNSPTTSQTSSGFVGNTNTTGAGVSTGGTAATGSNSTGGPTAVRAPRAVVAPGGTTTGTASTDTASTTANTADLSSQLQQALGDSTASRGLQDKSWNVTLEVRQVIYSGGQVGAAIRIAQLTQDSSYYQLRDVVDRIIAQVREQFYTTLVNRALITVSEEAVRLANQQLQDQRNRYEAGTVPKFNVLRAEVEVANVLPNLIRSKSDYLLAQIQLSKSLGLPPGPAGQPEFYCVGELSTSSRRISLPDALALARARRPFLKVQRQSILIDAETVKVELAGYKPRLDAHAGVELRNRSTSSDISDTVDGWFYGVTGSWNIFDGFGTYGRVKESRARLEQSKIHYDDSVREVELEVQSAYANLEQARQTIESQQKNVESANEALRLAQERFSAGAGTQLEVLDARVALTRARTTELQARGDFNRDFAEFDRATATQTVYHEGFRDPLVKVEKGIFARIAETALPKFRDDGK